MSVNSIQTTANLFGGNSAASSTATAQSGEKTATGLGDMNSFLKMFMAQLKNQDPSNPMESYELSAQLAQFSTVEKLTQVSSLLNELKDYSISMNNAALASMVGKDVTASKSTIDVSGDAIGTLDYKLDSPTAVTITISDAAGNTIRTIEKGAQAAGKYSVEWDGKDATGAKLPDGAYACKVEAVDTDGTPSELSTSVHGSVYSFRFEEGVPYYILNGENGPKLPVGDVLEITRAA